MDEGEEVTRLQTAAWGGTSPLAILTKYFRVTKSNGLRYVENVESVEKKRKTQKKILERKLEKRDHLEELDEGGSLREGLLRGLN